MRLIDADALMDELEAEKPEIWIANPFEVQQAEDWEHFYGKVSAAPTVDIERLVKYRMDSLARIIHYKICNGDGKWIQDTDRCTITCSECGEIYSMMDNDTERFNYCPSCGAKMDLKGGE